MAVYSVDPVEDPRWSRFIEACPQAGAFSTPAWLSALRRTYGYDLSVFTTSAPGTELSNGLPVCRVRSWLLGNRLVSLPFSDHCEPLANRPEDLGTILSSLAEEVQRGRWRYAEIRPLRTAVAAGVSLDGYAPAATYFLHRLDLSASLEELFNRFHTSCVQRKIRRAEREGLEYEAGRSARLLAEFYRLQQLTRRRQRLFAQPLAWFRNLIACGGENVTIHLASKNGQSVASMLTIAFKGALVYKYGCSDAQHHNLGGMPFLFWKTIQEAKSKGLEELDLGRSETSNTGLIAFKDHLGASRSTLTYYRCPATGPAFNPHGWRARSARKALALLPDSALSAASRILYRHLG